MDFTISLPTNSTTSNTSSTSSTGSSSSDDSSVMQDIQNLLLDLEQMLESNGSDTDTDGGDTNGGDTTTSNTTNPSTTTLNTTSTNDTSSNTTNSTSTDTWTAPTINGATNPGFNAAYETLQKNDPEAAANFGYAMNEGIAGKPDQDETLVSIVQQELAKGTINRQQASDLLSGGPASSWYNTKNPNEVSQPVSVAARDIINMTGGNADSTTATPLDGTQIYMPDGSIYNQGKYTSSTSVT